jgi:5,10-methylenetetrahydromethanopterin reductase
VTELAPLVDDLSIWVIPGRTKDPGQAITQAEEAERLGFKRIFLSERFDLKDAGALLGGALARTTRLIAGTGIAAAGARSPLMTASMAATLQTAYGGRFVLGLGRSSGPYLAGQGIGEFTYRAYEDYFAMLRALFRGETVTYDGPAGRYDALKTVDPCPGEPPELWATTMGGPIASKLAAKIADGIMLVPFLTVEAVARAVEIIRAERERLDLDPAITILHPIVVAPDLDDGYTRAIAHARFVTYIVGMPFYWRAYVRQNGWDEQVMQRILDHPQFTQMDRPTADQTFHRGDLASPADLVPDAWMQASCAIGSVDACVTRFAELKAAGVDEIACYGSSPSDNAALIAAWRALTPATATPSSP